MRDFADHNEQILVREHEHEHEHEHECERTSIGMSMSPNAFACVPTYAFMCAPTRMRLRMRSRMRSCMRSCMLAYARLCSPMLAYARVCSRMLAYTRMCVLNLRSKHIRARACTHNTRCAHMSHMSTSPSSSRSSRASWRNTARPLTSIRGTREIMARWWACLPVCVVCAALALVWCAQYTRAARPHAHLTSSVLSPTHLGQCSQADQQPCQQAECIHTAGADPGAH
jgi:hypothetical protein